MLERHETLLVRQEVEALQAFSGLETKNRYRIIDATGEPVCFAYEESGFLSRQFLGSHRPLTLNVVDAQGNLLLTARRDFFWFKSHLEFRSPQGAMLGRLERQFSFLGRRFRLFDSQGLVGELRGSAFRPNTFWLKRDNTDRARILKKWSGIGREMFTAADNFQVEFAEPMMPDATRWLVLGTAFAVDLDFFEQRGRRGGLGFGS